MPENNYQPDFNLKNQIGRDQEKNILTRKIAVGFLAVFGVFFISFGFYQTYNRIKKPFIVPEVNSNNPVDSIESRYLAALQNNDTDGDGLSDFDEINIHRTSPYLEDSDSDGISDYDEVMSGSDPNCAKGTDCYGLASNVGDVAASTSVNILPEINEGEINSSSTTTNNEDEEIIESLGTGEIDVNILRSMLVANGFDVEEVNKISDDELKAMYAKAVLDNANQEVSNE